MIEKSTKTPKQWENFRQSCTLKRTTMVKRKDEQDGKKIARVELTIVSYRSCPLSVNAKPNVALMRLASKPFK